MIYKLISYSNLLLHMLHGIIVQKHGQHSQLWEA